MATLSQETAAMYCEAGLGNVLSAPGVKGVGSLCFKKVDYCLLSWYGGFGEVENIVA